MLKYRTPGKPIVEMDQGNLCKHCNKDNNYSKQQRTVFSKMSMKVR